MGQDPSRPGIVHRLDKDTSGVLVVAKNDFTHEELSRQFQEHSIKKIYHAIVKGIVQYDEGICEEPVGRAFMNRKKIIIKPSGGKSAFTYYRVIKRFKKASFVEIRPKTGRTHQIRVHFAHIGHPVLGDSLYGISSKHINRQALHATSIEFKQPRSGKRIYVESDLPEDMKSLIGFLETGC